MAGGYVLILPLRAVTAATRIGETQSVGDEQAQIVNESIRPIKEIIVLQSRASFATVSSARATFLLATGPYQIVARSQTSHGMRGGGRAGEPGAGLGAREGGLGTLGCGTLTFLAFAAYGLLPTLQQVLRHRPHSRRPGPP